MPPPGPAGGVLQRSDRRPESPRGCGFDGDRQFLRGEFVTCRAYQTGCVVQCNRLIAHRTGESGHAAVCLIAAPVSGESTDLVVSPSSRLAKTPNALRAFCRDRTLGSQPVSSRIIVLAVNGHFASPTALGSPTGGCLWTCPRSAIPGRTGGTGTPAKFGPTDWRHLRRGATHGRAVHPGGGPT